MKKLESAEDLLKFRDRSRAEIDLREGSKDILLTVHMGTCGIAAGARDVLATIVEELGAAGISRAGVQQTGCVGLCDQEPMLTVTDKSGAFFRYGRLDRAKTREIILNHVLRGTVVNEYLIKD
ncbi:MAG: (2Fe-2S) ferredoxin domain-containing protein [Acidobacteria bacterium]|nr:(2Fe-2S) ferredoxin domain-containing protein [Acidobacteriota bacterium]